MIKPKNDDDGYGLVSIILHWLGAICVVAMLASAAAMYLAASDAAGLAAIQLHIALGVAVYPILAARVIWSWISRKPAPITRSMFERRASRLAHATLLILILSQLVTGPAGVWSGGYPVGIYSIFEIPSPFSAEQFWHEPIGEVHRYAGYTIAGILALHVAAVLKHQFIDRDNTLRRMFGLTRRAEQTASTVAIGE